MSGLAGSTGQVPAGRCPLCPTLRPFPPRPPPALGTEIPRFSSKSSARDRGERRCGTSIQLGTGATGQEGLAPSAEGSRCLEGRRAAPAGWPRDSPERGPGTERRRLNRPWRSSRTLPASRGQFGGTDREIPERAVVNGHLSVPSTRDPASLAGSSRPWEVALGITHLKYKSLPFGLKVTNWVGNTARARPQFAMATPEPSRVPTRVRSTP